MTTPNPQRFAVAGNACLRKLLERAGDDGSSVALLRIALATLPHEQDETIATQLLFSILLHDDLAEALDGRL